MQEKQEPTKAGSRKAKRDVHKERRWRRVIAQQQSSGKSIKKFCEDEGINANNFQWWRREIIARNQETSARLKAERIAETRNPFVAVQLAPEPEIIKEASLEIILPCGATIKVSSSTPLAPLCSLLKLLEKTEC